MKTNSKYVGLVVSILLFLVVVPYALIQWFDKTIPFSTSLYFFSGISILLLAYNIYSLKQED